MNRLCHYSAHCTKNMTWSDWVDMSYHNVLSLPLRSGNSSYGTPEELQPHARSRFQIARLVELSVLKLFLFFLLQLAFLNSPFLCSTFWLQRYWRISTKWLMNTWPMWKLWLQRSVPATSSLYKVCSAKAESMVMIKYSWHYRPMKWLAPHHWPNIIEHYIAYLHVVLYLL